MIGYLRRALVSRVRSDVVLYLLTVFGVALGVASVLSIRVLSAGATGAFAGTVDALGSDVELSVMGIEPTIPDSLYLTAYHTAGVAEARPIYEVPVTLADQPERFLDVFGVDLLRPPRVPIGVDAGTSAGVGASGEAGGVSEGDAVGQGGAVRESDGVGEGHAVDEGDAIDVLDAILTPGWMAVSPRAAERFGWSRGDTVRVASGTRYADLIVGAFVDLTRVNALAAPNLVVMDLAHVQALLGTPGRLTRIDLVLKPETDVAEVARELDARLPPSARTITPERRLEEANNLLHAFRLNLFALSLVSLVVGVYLVYGAVSASLVRRRRELGVLRSTGATSGQVLRLVLAEVAVLGLLGSAVGIPLGYASAIRNVEKVSQTVTNLYLLREIRSLSLSPDVIGLGLLVGLGAALLAVLVPAWELSRRPVRELLASAAPRARLIELAPRLAAIGIGMGALALVMYGLFGRTWRPIGFVLSMLALIGVTLVAPYTLQALSRIVPRRGFGFGFAIGNLASRLGSATTAVSALAVSVSMVVGVTVMVTSFRTTLVGWIDRTVSADVYVTTPSWARAGSDAVIDDETVARLAGLDGVEWVDRLRQVTLREPEGRFRVAGVNFSDARPDRSTVERRVELISGRLDGLRARVAAGGVLISEPLSRKRDLELGDSLSVNTGSGAATFPVVGVYTDYSSEWGAALLDLATFSRVFGEAPAQSLALYLATGVDAEQVVESIRAKFGDRALYVRSNRRLREETLALFDQTFAITDVLKLMAALVAVAGIALTLLIWTRERGRELALYRALGASPGQLFGLFVGEGVSLGLVGVGLGLVGGFALAMILVEVINRSYFGWTIRIMWPWVELGMQMIGVLAAAFVAGIYPAWVARGVRSTSLTEESQ